MENEKHYFIVFPGKMNKQKILINRFGVSLLFLKQWETKKSYT
jgi:hypothetical protein